jgi:hypothetical protein
MTNNKQQTAVEWLYNELLNSEPNILEWNKLLEQAKEMEKEQIRKAYCDGEYYKDTKLSTDYYEQTYGGGEQ